MTIIAMRPESARGDRAVVISYHPDLVAIEDFKQRRYQRSPWFYNTSASESRIRKINFAIARYVCVRVLLDEA